MQVTYINHMGDDIQVVNAARCSFGKKSEWDRRLDHHTEKNDTEQWEKEGWEFWDQSTSGDVYRRLSKADQGLIQFLARGCTSGDWEKLLKEVYEGAEQVADGWIHPVDREYLLNHIRKMPDHWTPFGHTAITLHIKAPIFVARQLGKHQVGFVWNEVSRRYITDEPEFYVPETWRKAAENVKQGSSEEAVTHMWMQDYGENFKTEVGAIHSASLEYAKMLYDSMIKAGVCAEQARMVLPQNTLTEWYWTGNLYGFANVYNQRTDPHTQKETRDVAHQIGEIIEPLFPHSWKCLTQ